MSKVTICRGILFWGLLFLGHKLRAQASVENPTFISFPMKPHHVVRRERRHRQRVLLDKSGEDAIHEYKEPERSYQDASVRRRDTALQVGALYQGYGTHYIDLWCGTPKPQRQTVIVDTGSGVTGKEAHPEAMHFSSLWCGQFQVSVCCFLGH